MTTTEENMGGDEMEEVEDQEKQYSYICVERN